MPPKREARTAVKNELIATPMPSRLSRSQAWRGITESKSTRQLSKTTCDNDSGGDGNSRDEDAGAEKTATNSFKTLLGSSTVSSSTELGEIQQSVQRLRAQRSHVERLSQRNEELEHQLSRQKAENETLRREVFILRGTEQENVGYLQSMKSLEQRARGMEEMCSMKKMELKAATEKLSNVEQERDRLLHEIANIRVDHEDDVKVLKNTQKNLLLRIEHLENSHGAQTDNQKRMKRHWKQKMKNAAFASSQTIDTLQQQLEQSCKEVCKFESEVSQLEKQVQNLVATTVRQTAIIDECDRVLSETKAQQQEAQRNYEEQLQCSRELSTKTQRLEVKVASLKQSKGSEAVELQKKVSFLESKLVEHNDQMQAAEEALRNKEKDVEVIQRAFATRSDNQFHLNEELHRTERRLKSDISELQIALRDATDEKNMLSEQVLELQEQLENERKDRSRWATARLKLLAEFCDEESKLSSALNHHADISLDNRKSTHKQKHQTFSPTRQKAKSRRTTDSNSPDEQNYDGDDSDKEDEQTRRIIVFG